VLLPRPELCLLDERSCQQLCEGKVEGGPTRTYKGMAVNKVWRDFMVLVGDFKGDDTGGYSSFADKYFEDENFVGRYASAQRGVRSRLLWLLTPTIAGPGTPPGAR